MTEYFARHAPALIDAGYLVIPIELGRKSPALADWRKARLDHRHVARWAKRGVGILTGQGEHPIAAVDIDTTDPELAERFAQWCRDHLGATVERVGNPPKVLLVYRHAAALPKVTGEWFEDLAGGRHRLEVLGDGQQFVAYHTHPDTKRPYEWVDLLGGLDQVRAADLPVITHEQIADALSAFRELAIEAGLAPANPVPVSGAIVPNSGTPAAPRGAKLDDVAVLLGHVDAADYDTWIKTGMALHFEFDGADDALALWNSWSSTVENYAGFDDLAKRWAGFGRHGGTPVTLGSLQALARAGGWVEDVSGDFEALPALVDDGPTVESEPAPFPAFARTKTGEVLATVGNLSMALRRPDITRVQIAYDTFRDELCLAPEGTAQWRPFTDADYTRLRERLEMGPCGFKPIGPQMIRDVVLMVAEDQRFDSAILWLEALPWDGTARVESFLVDYFGTADTPYTRAVSLYLWTALAGRVLEPGVKADMVPIMRGEQGLLKSSALAALAPAPEHFTEIDLNARDADQARAMRGCLVGEIAELRGLNTRDLESIKAFITRQHERWIPKYREFANTYPRRLVFFGTTNPDEFLADDTGNRRWLPFEVSKADIDAIRRDRLQLWAEARELFRAGGVRWQDAERLAPAEHENFRVVDSWEEAIARWLDEDDGEGGPKNGTQPFTLGMVLVGALGFDLRQVKRHDELRAGRALRALGCEKKVFRRDGCLLKMWILHKAPFEREGNEG